MLFKTMKPVINLTVLSFLLTLSFANPIFAQSTNTTNGYCKCDAAAVPVDQANMSATDITVWANEAAVAALSYNFKNYHTAFQSASKYFTTQGWQGFEQALQQSGNLNVVKSKKLVTSAVATGVPIVISQGLDHETGTYSWKVQIPMLVEYQNVGQVIKQHIIVTMHLVRTSQFHGTRGVGVDQFVMRVKPNNQPPRPKKPLTSTST